MVKNILLVVLTILSLMFFAFGYIQKIEADRQTELVITIKIEAEKAKAEELIQRDRAVAAQAEADAQRALAIKNEKRAVECEKGKRK